MRNQPETHNSHGPLRSNIGLNIESNHDFYSIIAAKGKLVAQEHLLLRGLILQKKRSFLYFCSRQPCTYCCPLPVQQLYSSWPSYKCHCWPGWWYFVTIFPFWSVQESSISDIVPRWLSGCETLWFRRLWDTYVSFMTIRPKPAYDRQGLAGGQDTDKMGTYWGVL